MMTAVEQLEVRTITEVYEDWTVTFRYIPIIEGVELLVYDESGQASLEINGQSVIEFNWTDEAATLFENIDVADPVELLELLSRLNRKLEADMLATRKANGLTF